jgi:hypothetical protein
MGKYQEASDRTKRGITSDYKNDDVYVSTSVFLEHKNIKGLGLFASSNLQAGYVVAEYLGKDLTDEQAENKKHHKQYMFDVKVKGKLSHVIDAANNKYSSVVKFVNAADTSKQQNCSFKLYNARVYLVLLQNIKKGSELLTWWKRHSSCNKWINNKEELTFINMTFYDGVEQSFR